MRQLAVAPLTILLLPTTSDADTITLGVATSIRVLLRNGGILVSFDGVHALRRRFRARTGTGDDTHRGSGPRRARATAASQTDIAVTASHTTITRCHQLEGRIA